MIARNLVTFGILLSAALLIMACGSKNVAVYTGPPSRITPLDSAGHGAGAVVQVAAPDSSRLSFRVPGSADCPVLITVHMSNLQKMNTVVDSLMPPGDYSIWFTHVDSSGKKLPAILHFYKLNICGKTTTKRLDLRLQYR